MEQLERIKAYAKDYRRVPIAKEIFADVRTVIGTLRVLKKVSRTAFLFESADNTERWGRYSFLGYDPKLVKNAGNAAADFERTGVWTKISCTGEKGQV